MYNIICMLEKIPKVRLVVIFAIALLIASSNQACSEGCLKCSSSGICNICDINLGFIFESDSCVQVTIENCELPVSKTNCLKCKDGFLVSSTGTCVAPNKVVLNCREYKSDGSCYACRLNYYPKESECLEVKTLIDDCAEYDSESTCRRCSTKLLSPDQKTCQTLPLSMDFNCVYYFFPQTCKQCKSGFAINETSYLKNLPDLNNKFAQLRKQKVKSKISYLNTAKCDTMPAQSLPITENICRFDSLYIPERCYNCPSGQVYSEVAKRCVANFNLDITTNNSIPNCSYLNLNGSCEICKEGFFLHYTQRECLPHTKTIPGCKVMSQRSLNDCFICQFDYYLSRDVKCTERVNKDKNCQTFSYFHDKCTACRTGYTLSNSNEVCVPVIPFCLVHIPGQNSVTCQTCESGYYLISGACLAVPADKIVTDCLEYNPGTWSCLKCAGDKKILRNTATNVYSCVSPTINPIFNTCYSVHLSNGEYQCNKCPDNGIKIPQVSTCIEDPSWPENCEEIWPDYKCRICSKGYYLALATGTCIEGADGNCLLYTDQPNDQALPGDLKCLLCDTDYFLFDNICFPNQKIFDAQNCYTKDSYGNCILCRAGYSYTFDSTLNTNYLFSCENQNKFTSIISNCSSMIADFDSKGIKTFTCVACKDNYYLAPATNECVFCGDNCTFTGNSFEVLVDATAVCLIKSSESCIQFKLPNLPYYTGVSFSTTVTGMHFYNSQFYESVYHVIPSGSVTSTSDKVAAIFYADLSAKNNDSASHVTCVNGWARTFTAGTLNTNTNDCTARVKNCLVDSDFVWRSAKRILASCNQCANNQVVHFTTATIPVTSILGISSNLQSGYSSSNVPSTFCAASNLFAAADSVTYCAAYEVLNATSKKCVECIAGYKATITNGYVSACVSIANCTKSRIGDLCEECNLTGFALKSTKQECVTNTQNCKRLEVDNSCAECVPGYFWKQNSCQKINDFYDCAAYGKGSCIQCKNPSLVAFLDKQSAFNDLVKCTNNGSTLPPSCTLVDINGFCVKCVAGYMPNQNGECFLLSNIPNCRMYDPVNQTCILCKQGYVYDPLEEMCVAINLPQPNITCSGLYSSPLPINQGLGTRCSTFEIDNCQLIDTYSLFNSGTLKCSKCYNRFKIQDISAAPINDCVLIEPYSNCKTHSINVNLTFRCTECNTGFMVNEFGMCIPRPLIPKCEVYEITSEACSICQTGYFVSNGKCSQRKNLYDFCIEYYTFLDECKTINPSYEYFWVYSKVASNPPGPGQNITITDASSNFNGVLNCVKYLSPTICELCNDQTYLIPEQNACVPVVNKVENCQVYFGPSECEKCVDGFAGNGLGACIKVTGNNCLKADFSGKCSICPPTHPVMTALGNCEKNTNVPNCRVYRSLNQCQECEPGYYVENFVCLKASTEIANCAVYASQSTCSTCKTGYFVNSSGTCTQNPNFDNQCEVFELNVSGCAICGEGFVLKDGYCSRCGSDFESCAVCDPNVPSNCLMCKSGYWMDSKGVCTENKVAMAFIPAITISIA